MMTRFNGFSVDGSILDNDYYSVAGQMDDLPGGGLDGLRQSSARVAIA